MLPGSLGRMVDAFLGNALALSSDPESTPLLGEETPPVRGDVGLIHHVPFAVVYQKTWGSLVEQAFLNTTHAKMYLAIVRTYSGILTDFRTQLLLNPASWGNPTCIRDPTSHH